MPKSIFIQIVVVNNNSLMALDSNGGVWEFVPSEKGWRELSPKRLEPKPDFTQN